MKVLKIIGNIIFGIILFLSIFCLTFIVKTKNFLEKDLIHEAIKVSIEDAYKGEEGISNSQKEIVDNMFEDSEADGIIDLIIDNYREYRNNTNYRITTNDAEKLYDFVLKYKDDIHELSGEDVSKMSSKEFEEFFNYNKINEFAHDTFDTFDKEIGDEKIDKAFDAYSYATSSVVKSILISMIVVCILFLILINWSLIKWSLVTGICLIISGTLMMCLYEIFNILLNNVDVNSRKISLNINGYLITGIIELVLGIVLVANHGFLNKKFNKDNTNITR